MNSNIVMAGIPAAIRVSCPLPTQQRVRASSEKLSGDGHCRKPAPHLKKQSHIALARQFRSTPSRPPHLLASAESDFVTSPDDGLHATTLTGERSNINLPDPLIAASPTQCEQPASSVTATQSISATPSEMSGAPEDGSRTPRANSASEESQPDDCM